MRKNIRLTAIIPPNLQGLRADQIAATLLPQFSRAQHQKWIRDQQLLFDQQAKRCKDKITQAYELTLNGWIEEATPCQPQALSLSYEYIDEHLIVVNKPAGLTVHPGAGQPDHTLVNALLHHHPDLALLPRAGLIHRLDKNTSGLLIIARQPQSHLLCLNMMQARAIKRCYLALVWGTPISGGCIDHPIGRHPNARTKMAVRSDGRSAITHFRVLEKYQHHSLIHCELETGRTHQIRVHLHHIHHPIVGDPSYKKHGGLAHLPEHLRQELQVINRQLLHATSLSFNHPITQKAIHLTTPPPADFLAFQEACQCP